MEFPRIARDTLARRTGPLDRGGPRRRKTALRWQVELDDGLMGVHCDVDDGALSARIRRALVASLPQRAPGLSPQLWIERVPAVDNATAARKGKLTLPANLDFYVPTEGRLAVSRELSLARQWRAGLELSVVRDRRQTVHFYNTLYLPTLARTHPEGRASSLRELEQLGHGWLMLLSQDTQVMAGGLMFESPLRSNEGWFSHLGYVPGAPAFIRAAPYVAALELSRRFGFAATDLLAALPLLSDGLAQHKLAWGSQVRTFAAEGAAASAALRLSFASTHALIRFCRRHPIVVLTQGDLIVLASERCPRLPSQSTRLNVEAFDPGVPIAELTTALYARSAALLTAAGS
ncbi:MAG TPA: hypothetical protein PKA88_23415 [Polyangiaceae bacterium]|nr:hypothetical protein [Polyangiaceae bacterium]HMR77481.1 hypothetical protein [Polyangiaceae bacterium]